MMKTAQIIGIETEYALFAEGEGHVDPAILFEGWQPPYPARWDYRPERPWCDARGFVPAAAVPTTSEALLELVDGPGQPASDVTPASDTATAEAEIQIDLEEPPCVMLANGARFYLDHGHPEWCTPECATPLDVVAYDRAGEIWLRDLVALVNTTRAEHQRLALYKNNVDPYGNTYGCHENYLVDAVVYSDLFERKAHRLYTVLLPFLVTRQVICGAGKVARLPDGAIGFQIAQRSDRFETLLGLQTTYNRPVINTRDEPHADPQRFRRLHVIVGDTNMSEISTYLKVGSTALILEMLARNCLRLNLTLADPLAALHTVACDPSCMTTVELETGRRYTAVDLQRCFVEAAGRYLDELGDDGYRRDVWEVWADTVERLASDRSSLSTRLDWVIKYEYLRGQMDARSWTWADPQVRKLDLRYHALDTERGLFELLRRQGLVDELLEQDEILAAREQPPQTTRARLRVACLERYREQVRAVNWDSMVFVGDKGNIWRWRWSDPTDAGDEQIDRLLQSAQSLEALVLALVTRSKDASGDDNGRAATGNT